MGGQYMIETLHQVLTSTESRDADALRSKLEDEASAGTPWFN